MTVLAIAWTALRRFLADRSNMFFVFVFPLGLILIIGLAFGGQTDLLVGTVAGEDPVSRGIVAAVEDVPGLQVVHVASEAELVARVERGGLSAGVLVPAGIAERVAAGETVAVDFLATSGGAGQALRFTVDGAVSRVTERLRAAVFVAQRADLPLDESLSLVDDQAGDGPGTGVRREWIGESAFGDEVQTFDVGAGSQLVLFVFMTGITASTALIQSRRLGVSRRMLAAPVRPLTIVAGEAIGYLAVVLFQGLYIIVASSLLFGVDWGDPVGATLLLVAFGAVAAAAGMLVGSVFRNDQQAAGISVLLGLGLAALGGAMAPLELFSGTMRTVARAVPHSWAVEGFGLLLRHGAGVGDVLPNVGVLLAFAAVLFGVAAWRFRAVLLEA